jgi:hypothetical protein
MFESLLRPAAAAVLACSSIACTAPRVPAVPPAAISFPRASETPVTTVHLVMVTPESLPAFLSAREDVARPVGRWWRAGDGSVSLRLSTANGRPLCGVECGGVLLVPGKPGEALRLHVHNERDLPAEATISIHHADLRDGRAPSTLKPGIHLDPHSTQKISARFDATHGRAVPLEFTPMSSPRGLLRHDLAAQQGVIRVALHAASRWIKPQRLQPIMPRTVPQPSPIRTSLPYEYR